MQRQVDYVPWELQTRVRCINVRNPHAEKLRGREVTIVGYSPKTGAYAVEFGGIGYAPFRHEDFEKL